MGGPWLPPKASFQVTLFFFFSVSVSRSVMSESHNPCTVVHQVPLWNSSGKNTRVALPFLSLGGLPDPGIKPGSPALQADCLLSELPGKLSFSLGTLQTPDHVSVGSGLQNAPRKTAGGVSSSVS